MLFELRNSKPEVSAAWHSTRYAFLEGRVRDAWRMASELRGNAPLETGNDYLLNIEVARACSVHKTYMALVRCAFRAFPQHPMIQLYLARVLQTQSRQTEGIEFLLSCEKSLGETHRALWGTELANMYASAGFGKKCCHWLEAVQDEEGIDSPLALYSQSCAHSSLQHWDEAISFAERSIAAAPGWTRARAYLTHCLLARGRVEEAKHHIAVAESRKHQEQLLDVASALLPLSLGEWHIAKSKLQALLNNWPSADSVKWIRRTLCILHVELGDYAEARTIAAGEEKKMALPPIPESGEGKHCFIPLPLLAQNHNQCVPTSVAMAIYPQGKNCDPDTMFHQMHGREGTPLWRMREWCETNGYRVVAIRIEQEGILQLLDANIPLMGVLEGLFNSHVNVVCGYNSNLNTFYVRDPSHWAPVALPWEMIQKRYRTHMGLFAIIEATRTDLIELAEQFCSTECNALLDLSQAVSNGRLSEAEAAFEQIADDSPAAFLRDSCAANVVISPIRLRERMQAIAEDESAELISRFRAMLSIGGAEGSEILEELIKKENNDKAWTNTRRYLQLYREMDDGAWENALQLVDRLLLRGCGVARFWELKSDILAELGKHDASNDALDNAIELEPLRSATREKALNRAIHYMTFEEYLKEFETLLADDPSDKGLLFGRAIAMQNSPDGKAYELAAREAIHWFPRFPNAYTNLQHWYLIQNREDLLNCLMEEATRLLPDVFQKPDSKSNALSSNHTLASEKENVDLPEERKELLDLVWRLDDPLREKALTRAIELQNSGQLHWYEVARLIACRLLFPPFSADKSEPSEEQPEALLPDSPPGAAHWFAGVLCALLNDYRPTLRTVLAVDQWLLRVVPNLSDYSELWFERVLLLEQAEQLEQALIELQRLLERYPAMSSALYRMGVVKYRQKDYPSAREYFEKALAIDPGLLGAMDMLRTLFDTLREPEKSYEYTRMLRRKMPYSVRYLSDEVFDVAKLKSPAEAEALLKDVSGDFPPKRVAVLHARLDMISNRVEDAANRLAKIELSQDDDDDFFEECLQAKIDIAYERNDSAGLIQICDSGLQRWPDSALLREIKAEQLADINLQASCRLLREVCIQGGARPETVWQLLNQSQNSPDSVARETVLAAPEDQQQTLAQLFADVMHHPKFLRNGEAFLTWATKKFPESETLQLALISWYSMGNQHKKAVRLAEALHQKHPKNLEALRALGCCLTDVDAKKGLQYLRKACEQNRSSDYLFDLARCYQAIDDQTNAKKLHWEILEQNPFMAASWTNLHLLGAPCNQLWSYLLPLLDQGCGLEDEYFLVSAVNVAIDQKKKLPVAWYHLALQRWEILFTRSGYRDEKSRLKYAMLAWQAVRPLDIPKNLPHPKGYFSTLATKICWPRRAWIDLNS